MNFFKNPKKERGFTLIEMLIGLALLSVITLNSQEFAANLLEQTGFIERELEMDSNIREAIHEKNRDILSADDLKILKEDEEGGYTEVEFGEMGERIKLINDVRTIEYYIENNSLYREQEGSSETVIEFEQSLDDFESKVEFTNFKEGDREYIKFALRTKIDEQKESIEQTAFLGEGEDRYYDDEREGLRKQKIKFEIEEDLEKVIVNGENKIGNLEGNIFEIEADTRLGGYIYTLELYPKEDKYKDKQMAINLLTSDQEIYDLGVLELSYQTAILKGRIPHKGRVVVGGEFSTSIKEEGEFYVYDIELGSVGEKEHNIKIESAYREDKEFENVKFNAGETYDLGEVEELTPRKGNLVGNFNHKLYNSVNLELDEGEESKTINNEDFGLELKSKIEDINNPSKGLKKYNFKILRNDIYKAYPYEPNYPFNNKDKNVEIKPEDYYKTEDINLITRTSDLEIRTEYAFDELIIRPIDENNNWDNEKWNSFSNWESGYWHSFTNDSNDLSIEGKNDSSIVQHQYNIEGLPTAIEGIKYEIVGKQTGRPNIKRESNNIQPNEENGLVFSDYNTEPNTAKITGEIGHDARVKLEKYVDDINLFENVFSKEINRDRDLNSSERELEDNQERVVIKNNGNPIHPNEDNILEIEKGTFTFYNLKTGDGDENPDESGNWDGRDYKITLMGDYRYSVDEEFTLKPPESEDNGETIELFGNNTNLIIWDDGLLFPEADEEEEIWALDRNRNYINLRYTPIKINGINVNFDATESIEGEKLVYTKETEKGITSIDITLTFELTDEHNERGDVIITETEIDKEEFID